MKQSRRDFLKRFSQTAGCFVATASIAPLVGCSRPESGATAYSFPQGVASADPQADAIILWTRVVPEDATETSVDLAVQVARDGDFVSLGFGLEGLDGVRRERDAPARIGACHVDYLY